MTVPVFRCSVHAGQLRMTEPARWAGYLGKLEGKIVRVTVQRETTRRSPSANRYLWGVVYATLAEWSGHEAEELHEAFRAMFLPQRVTVGVLIPGSTSELSIEGFSEYVNKVKRWAAEQGVYVPEANEVEVTA